MAGYVVVAVVAVAVLAFTIRSPRPPWRAAPRFVVGGTIWLVLIVAAAAWELVNYFQSPRSDHPTMSSMIDAVVDSSAAAGAAAFGLWVALGIAFARR